MEAILPTVLDFVVKKLRYLQNEGTFLWNFPKLCRTKFRHGTSTVAANDELDKVDAQRVINWTVVRQLS